MFLGRVRALVEQAVAPPRAPVQETTATSPAVIVAGNILCYKNTEPTPDDHCRFLVQSEQETSYCYRKCEMVSAKCMNSCNNVISLKNACMQLKVPY